MNQISGEDNTQSTKEDEEGLASFKFSNVFKGIFLFLLVVIVLGTISSFITNKNSDDFSKFENDYFSFEYPANWTEYDEALNIPTIKAGFVDQNNEVLFKDNVIIEVIDTPLLAPDARYIADKTVETMKLIEKENGLSDFKKNNFIEKNYSNYRAGILTAEYKISQTGATVVLTQYIIPIGNKSYVLSLSVSKQNYEKANETIIPKVVDSFLIKKPYGNTTSLEEKEAQEQKQQEEAQKEEISEDNQSVPSIEAQKKYYIQTTKPEVDAVLTEYDFVWESLWSKTFSGLSEGSIGFSDGIKNLKVAQKRYEKLYIKIQELPANELDDETKKKIGSFVVEIQDALTFRLEAIKQAKKMLEKEDLSSSKIEGIQTIVGDSDNYLYQALAYLTQVEQKFDIKR
ncbi:hypothetical protein [Paenibacillus sp. OSY-SE]|uniref:hypothetical protein n=1 Tax=Paenibacillus sp. OSY-SE TaxID=1196323 RepID=UPI0002FF351F|nr:hypothetical protein [Paenibacillus sp. OSY-SE]